MANTSSAVDLADVKAPVEILDRKVTSGPRTLWLPAGHWFLVDAYSQVIDTGGRSSSFADIATFLQVENGKRVLGARLFILRTDLLATNWGFSPCGGAEDIYLKDRSPNRWQSDCLTLYSRRKGVMPLTGNARSMQKSNEWMAANHVQGSDYSVVITYARYATNTFGVLSLNVPSDRFDSDASAIAWAETVRTALKPFCEHRSDEGRFPELPPAANEAETPDVDSQPVR